MAAGTTIQHKRKAGAFTGGQLASGEMGVDTTNGVVYFSVDGSTVAVLKPRLPHWLATTTSAFTITGTVPLDNTIMQSSEGTEIITKTVLPTDTNDYLKFTVSMSVDQSGVNALMFGIFRDSVADAVRMTTHDVYSSGVTQTFTWVAYVQVPSTSSQVWKLRAGPDAGTLYVNRSNSGELFSTSDAVIFSIEQVTLS